MKKIIEFITESQLSDKVFCEQFNNMFKGTNINKDTITIILTNIDKDFIKKLNKYFITVDNANYIAYESSDDLFINYDTNKDKIISQMADYIIKYKI